MRKLIIAILIVNIGCTAKKKLEKEIGSVEIVTPFSSSKYQSDQHFLRTISSGVSQNIATSKKIALQNAKTEMAGNIETIIQSVADQYIAQNTINNKVVYKERFEVLSRVVVNQSLSGIKTAHSKVFANGDEYTTWVVIEKSKDEILASSKQNIDEANEMQLKIDKAQFEKIFNKEMEQYD